MMANI